MASVVQGPDVMRLREKAAEEKKAWEAGDRTRSDAKQPRAIY
jgi:hypothetical protein